MAFINLQRDSFERSAVTLRPKVHFISSSAGVTGSEFVSPVRSKCIKSLEAAKQYGSQTELFKKFLPFPIGDGLSFDATNTNPAFDESDALLILQDGVLKMAAAEIANGTEDVSGLINRYMLAVKDAPHDIRFTKTIDVHRFDPGFKFEPPFGLNFTIKNNVRNIMMPHYNYKFDDCGFYYRNYNTINFFTASNLPEDSALIYPDPSNNYVPDSGFAVSFWINPRYQNTPGEEFNPGTILHVSSSICLSLISGSSVDINEKVDTYKILVQLSQSADIPPNTIDFSADREYPSDLLFTSSHELKHNHWHHVTFNWGSKFYNNYTGSLFIDDNKTEFAIPSQSLGTEPTAESAIFVGNYYHGLASEIPKFFNRGNVKAEGLAFEFDSGKNDPAGFVFDHPLNAEFHELKIFSTHLTGTQVRDKRYSSETSTDDLRFYLPPFYFPSSSRRAVLQTPFQKTETATNDPFNVAFSFGVGGKEINAENFLLDFKHKVQPRLFNMTSSNMTSPSTVTLNSADEYVYASGSILKRNFLFLPNDNGQFFPQFKLVEDMAITTGLTGSYIYRNEGADYGRIILEKMMPTGSLLPYSNGTLQTMFNSPTPDNPGVIPNAVLTIGNRTQDVSSNEIVVFNISNLYYGNRILPESFEVIESGLTGSHDRVKITLKDNGRGSLYRADCLTEQARWASVGNIFYDEGVSIIKSPHLFYMCKDRTEIKLRGEHNIHTFIVNVPVDRSILNKSTNDKFKDLPPSENANDEELTSIQLSSVNIHDENFNIIMRANFSQPITKTEEDEFVVRLKEDF